MKYLILFSIINILANFGIFSSADDSIDPDVKNVFSTATITISSDESSKHSSLPGKILFFNDEKKQIESVREGSKIHFDIKVETKEMYKNGRVLRCDMFESTNPKNRESLFSACSKSDNVEDWIWEPEKLQFETMLTVKKLSESTSDSVTIECSAIVCKDLCPDSCPEKPSKRKRRGLFKKPFSFFFRARNIF